MIYVSHQVLDLNTIKMNRDDYYTGPDEIKSMFVGAMREIDEKFFNKNLPVIFKTPSIRTGIGKGSMGYGLPRAVFHKTKKGQVPIAWADNVGMENGKPVYTPVTKKIGLNQRTLTLGPDDIEFILWMMLFNPNLKSPTNPSGITYLEDKEAEAMEYEQSETSAAVISYWLFRKESPFYASDIMISTLCLAWGVNPENKSITYKKQLLAEAVKKAEKKNDIEFNFNAFNGICEKLKDGQDTNEVDALALAQKCINKKVIRFDQDKLAWMLLGIEGNTIKTICKVPPQMISTARNVLKRHLLGAPDDVQTLQSALLDDAPPSKHDRVLLGAALPEDVTVEYIQNEMSWPDKKALYKFLGHEPRNKTMEDIHPVLIEYFVVNKRTVPWDLKK